MSCLVFLLAVCASCSEPSRPTTVVEPKPEVRASPTPTASDAWYDPAATRHDFGLILAGSDVTRTHVFRIGNRSALPIRVKGVANRKPCCGDVAPVSARVVEPGQFVEVTVILKVGLAVGQILHVAELETEEPGSGSHVDLLTSATAHARATIEGVESSAGPLFPGHTRRMEFLVRSFGVAANPPPPLDDRAIRCGLSAEWIDPPLKRVDEESGLDEIRRTLAVTIPSSSEPGSRSETLEMLDGSGAVAGRQWIGWEVATALKASPTGLIFATEAHTAEGLKFDLRTLDKRPFLIVSATTEIDGLNVSIDGSDTRSSHILTARFAKPGLLATARSGEIVIRTDHPGQPVMKVAVYVIARADGEKPRDAPEKSR